MSMLIVLFMYGTWTTVFSLGKMALAVSPPLFLTATRMLLAGVLIVGFLFLRKRTLLKLSMKQIGSLALLGLFSIYLTNASEFWGLQYLSAAKTCFIYSLSPFFAALFSYLHFGEKMNGRKWIGLLIGLLGIVPILLTKEGHLFGAISWPELAIVGAALFSVYGWVLLRMLVKDSEVSPLAANGVSMLFGGAMALVHSFFVDNWAPLPVAESDLVPFGQGLLIMTFVSNIVCYNLYGLMLKRYTATFLSFMGLLSPIFASITSYFLIGEPLQPLIFLGTGIVSLGLYLVYSAELAQGYIRSPSPIQS
jgi:drug/metabolite transporter (DMT)-like permease